MKASRVFTFAAMIAPGSLQANPLQPVLDLDYDYGRAELVLAEDADQTCGDGLHFGQITLREDVRSYVQADFPADFAPQDGPTLIRIRRGEDLSYEVVEEDTVGSREATREDFSRPPPYTTEDWDFTASAEIDVCVGLGTLQILSRRLSLVGEFAGLRAEYVSELDSQFGSPRFEFDALRGSDSYTVREGAEGTAQYRGSPLEGDFRELGLMTFIGRVWDFPLQSIETDETTEVRLDFSVRFMVVMAAE